MSLVKDLYAIVTITNLEYEALVRESERLRIIEALLKKNNYVSTGDLQAVFGTEESEEKKNAETV